MDEMYRNDELSFLDLPEEMIWLILSHLEDYELYLNVRSVCQMLQDVVEDYIDICKYKN